MSWGRSRGGGKVAAESEREKAYVHDDGFYAQHEIELQTGTSATALDPGASRITLADCE